MSSLLLSSQHNELIPKRSTTPTLQSSNAEKLKSQDDSSDGETSGHSVARGGVVTPFPWKVHDMLERAHIDGIEDIVSWLPHGRAFLVHKVDTFVQSVMPIWFSQTKFASFQRQLNLYGFRRMTTGKDKGAYFHEHFLRGMRQRVQQMTRQKIKGIKSRKPSLMGAEPNFWHMPRLLPTQNGEDVTSSTIRINPASQQSQSQNTKDIHIILPASISMCEKSAKCSNSGPPTPTLSLEEPSRVIESDILYFEGKPFHYLDRSSFAESHFRLEEATE